jgi:hypothetical protein
MTTQPILRLAPAHWSTTLILVLGIVAFLPNAAAQHKLTQRRHPPAVVTTPANAPIPLANAFAVPALNLNLLLPSNYFPRPGSDCSETFSNNVKVNQNCLNIVDSDYFSNEAQEVAIAQDPNHPAHLVAVNNDWKFGEFAAAHYSLDGGQHWRDSLPNAGLTRGNAFGGVSAETWAGFHDTSVAWDTKGNVYVAGLTFAPGPAGFFTSNADASTGVYVFRSILNNGASWTFPGRPVAEFNNVAGTIVSPFGNFVGEDKPYMTIDNHVGSPFHDRIYVAWNEGSVDGSIVVYESYSADYGESFSPRVLVSSSSALCTTNPFGASSITTTCNFNWFPYPFTGPDGALYVLFVNFNNAYAAQPSNCPGIFSPGNTNPCDNHNQILLTKSMDGGVSFSAPVKVADNYQPPDCPTYAGVSNPTGLCLPEKASSANAVFAVSNFAVGMAHPQHPNIVVVTLASYINSHSNESNGCIPGGFNPATFGGLYSGVKTAGACNNKILLSLSTDGGLTFTGGKTDARLLPTVNQGSGQRATDQWFQWAAFTRSGELVVSYYDRSYGNSETTGAMDISLSGSYDGIHFQTKRVTSSSMPLPTQNVGAWMGEYVGLSAVDDVHPIWTDTRDASLFLCPGTGKPGMPPQVCTKTEPNGIIDNNQEIFTATVDPP